MPKHWTEKLFIDDSELFEAVIENRFEKTGREIDALMGLFNEYKVPESGYILDLACGIGRIAIPLAKKGYNVVGIDISESYLEKATKYAEKEGVSDKTSFIKGDMRNLITILDHPPNHFDAVLNMWTSIGYWDEETDRSILRQSLALTNTGGVFIIHMANRDYLVKNFTEKDFEVINENLVILRERCLDLENSRIINYWTYYSKDGEDLRFLNRMEINHRLYSMHELKKLFQSAEWSYLNSYGGFELEKLTTDHFSMIMIAQK